MSSIAKPHLILLPGFMGQQEEFSHLNELLSGHVQMRTLELPQAVNTAQVFEEVIVTWFKNIRATLPRQFYLYGYSLGGRMAMAVAQYLIVTEPEALLGLFLESAHPGLQKPDDCYRRLQWDTAWAKAFGFEPMPAVLGRWFQQSVFQGMTEQQIDTLVAQRLNLNGRELATQIMQFSLGWQPDFRTVLADEALNVWYFTGEHDRKFTAVGKQLQGVSHHIAECASHNIHFQNPQWIADRIINVLKDVEQHP
ncbi:2-succinyl-6-hydroxy-2,4-cyclohexadiene-1-carboxylate synthase [Alteromonadaceae bacterium 2753L.S.0a.02]|nr:2-succinyl-6-hydroxy-2,4-cyclohexadiene-1-carboxylate synthase [Alteromonadaceae bacterium 2753L.S.0a.02]